MNIQFVKKNLQSAIYDFHLNHLILYQNGEQYQTVSVTSIEATNWCLKNLCQGANIFLIGSSRETERMYLNLSMSKYQFNICCYDVEFPESNRNVNQQPSLHEIVDSLNEIKSLFQQEQHSNANYALFNTLSSQCETKDIKELKSLIIEYLESISKKQLETQYLVSEIYNNRELVTSSNENSEIINELRKELAAYKNDFYLKSMQNFGVNIVIELLERLYTEKNLITQKGNVSDNLKSLEQIISFCEIKIKKLNLKVRHSTIGEEFDGSRMVNYDDKVSTDNDNLKGRVAYSISPAVYWTLPRVNAPGEDELLIKEEIVALYE